MKLHILFHLDSRFVFSFIWHFLYKITYHDKLILNKNEWRLFFYLTFSYNVDLCGVYVIRKLQHMTLHVNKWHGIHWLSFLHSHTSSHIHNMHCGLSNLEVSQTISVCNFGLILTFWIYASLRLLLHGLLGFFPKYVAFYWHQKNGKTIYWKRTHHNVASINLCYYLIDSCNSSLVQLCHMIYRIVASRSTSRLVTCLD